MSTLREIFSGTRAYLERVPAAFGVSTYVMSPHDLVGARVRLNFALKVHVVAFLDVVRIHVRSELQTQDRDN